MTKHTPTLGPGVTIDVPRLLVSRLLLQANSGGGKSWALRRILEQTHGAAQQIVIDVEGEFHTLREKYDYVLAGKGGDCPADLRSAELLARRLLELNVSAIVDIYELGTQRTAFVAKFLGSLMSAPRELWHPVLVVIDEAHLFCPEKGRGEAESTSAVIDLMTRGRKRGFCGVLATQRISKLNKDAAAEANNKLIGRSALDVDMKRAGEELGFSSRDELQQLRRLAAGQFFAFGPAISAEVVEVRVGDVQTSHPEAGEKTPPPTPPRDRIRKVLGELADLPAEAEAEAKTAAELRAKVRELEREVRAAKTAAPAPKVEAKVVEKPVIKPADLARIEKVMIAGGKIAMQAIEFSQRFTAEAEKLRAAVMSTKEPALPVNDRPPPAGWTRKPGTLSYSEPPVAPGRRVYPSKHAAVAYDHKPDHSSDPGDPDLTGPERRLLEALTWLEAIGQDTPPIEAVAFLADYRPGGGAFNNVRGQLRSKGLVEYPSPGAVRLTELGRAKAPYAGAPGSGEQLRATVLSRLAGPERKLLEPLIAAYPDGLSVDELAAQSGYGAGGGAFNNTRGRLRTLGLADYPRPGAVRAADLLFPEAS